MLTLLVFGSVESVMKIFVEGNELMWRECLMVQMDSGGVNARMHIHTTGWVGSLSLCCEIGLFWGHKHMPVTSVS